MTRRGVALLATLWLLVGLSAVTAASVAAARHVTLGLRNRAWLLRAHWAREACLGILLARSAAGGENGLHAPTGQALPRVDLGGGIWCEAVWEPTGQRLNVNTAGFESLTRLLGDPEAAAALLDWRDADSLPRPGGAERDWYRSARRRTPRNGHFAAIEELAFVRGFDSARAAALERWLTARPGELLDPNHAPLQLLAVLPGIGEEALGVASELRRRRFELESWGDLARHLSQAAAAHLRAAETELGHVAAFGPQPRWIRIRAGLVGTPLTSESAVAVQTARGRLAVLMVEAP
jgi:type II secretory pathway component PulK